jgi:hypothetical protein
MGWSKLNCSELFTVGQDPGRLPLTSSELDPTRDVAEGKRSPSRRSETRITRRRQSSSDSAWVGPPGPESSFSP